MAGYTKLFSDIVESSIWDEDADTCKVWITLLALSDSEGFVRGSPGWLSKRARVSLDKCLFALTKFKSPDPISRTSENQGRRIEDTPDGWVIVNYTMYREMNGRELSKDSRRTYQREWMRNKRCQQVLTGVNRCKPSASASASASASVPKGVQGEVNLTLPEKPSHQFFDPFGNEIPAAFRTTEFLKAVSDWHGYKSERKEAYKPRGARACLSKMISMGTPDVAIQALNEAMANNWQGFFPAKPQKNGNGHSNGNIM